MTVDEARAKLDALVADRDSNESGAILKRERLLESLGGARNLIAEFSAQRIAEAQYELNRAEAES
jgi:hypothetical protein